MDVFFNSLKFWGKFYQVFRLFIPWWLKPLTFYHSSVIDNLNNFLFVLSFSVHLSVFQLCMQLIIVFAKTVPRKNLPTFPFRVWYVTKMNTWIIFEKENIVGAFDRGFMTLVSDMFMKLNATYKYVMGKLKLELMVTYFCIHLAKTFCARENNFNFHEKMST